ncbi:amidohydrolase family protein [Streptomyces sp. NPDC059441]|uniref:amidohydrolase family protein n=1 Tax=Streptomyces sp. NPDC059441 TaxID=3346829 RepID=UPI00368E040F
MDRNGIATAMLSMSSPDVHFGDDKAASLLARRVNEYTAELTRDHPGRFGNFVSLPLPGVDGALEEIAFAFAELDVDGVAAGPDRRGFVVLSGVTRESQTPWTLSRHRIPKLDIHVRIGLDGRPWTVSTTCAMWYRTRSASIRRRPSSCPQLLPRSRSRGTGKIRTIRGPTEPQRPPLTPLPQFRGSQALYHQQTKNVLAAPRSTPYGRRVHSEELAECDPQFRRQGSRIRANVDGTALSVTPTRSPVLIGSAKSSSTQDG